MATVPVPIYGAYSEQSSDMQSHSTIVADGNKGLGQREWRVPPTPTLTSPPPTPVPFTWTEDPQDIPGIWERFQREEMNRDYPLIFFDPDGRDADIMALKLQGDHLSSQERAYRLRHASHVRCVMHAANRRRGHGTSSGVHARTVSHIQDMIVSRNAGG